MTDTPAGATPVVPDATPGQSATDASSAAPATGTGDQLGEAGKRALEAERATAREAQKRATAAEKALAELQAAHQTDQEKAIAQARAEGVAEAMAKGHLIVRRSEVRRALATAGCSDVDLAATAGEFADLAVTETGDVEGLDKAVTAFKAAHPALFTTAKPASFDQGTGGGQRPAAGRTFTRAQLADHAFYLANKAEITDALRDGRIRG